MAQLCGQSYAYCIFLEVSELRTKSAVEPSTSLPSIFPPARDAQSSSIDPSQHLQLLLYLRDALVSQDAIILEAMPNPQYHVEAETCKMVEEILQDLQRHFPDLAVPFTSTARPTATRSQIRLAFDRVQARISEIERHGTGAQHQTRNAQAERPQDGTLNAVSIGQQIKARRLQCKLTQAALAELVGIDLRQLQRHEKDVAKPNDLTLSSYNRVFLELIGKEGIVIKKP